VQRRHDTFQLISIKKPMRAVAVGADLKRLDCRMPYRDSLTVLSEISTRNPVWTVVVKEQSTASHRMVGPELVA
jgi:hypothetical protein